MGVVLKEMTLNNGFVHHKKVSCTYMLLCVSNNGYFINLVQERKEGEKNESITVESNIKDEEIALNAFKALGEYFAGVGFGASHTGYIDRYGDVKYPGEEPGKKPKKSIVLDKDSDKDPESELFDDLANALDE